MYVYAWEACESCSLVPLAKGGATIGTPSLTQCKAEDDTQGEEEDGTQDPQASEVILEDTNSVTQTHTHTPESISEDCLDGTSVYLSTTYIKSQSSDSSL